MIQAGIYYNLDRPFGGYYTQRATSNGQILSSLM